MTASYWLAAATQTTCLKILCQMPILAHPSQFIHAWDCTLWSLVKTNKNESDEKTDMPFVIIQ